MNKPTKQQLDAELICAMTIEPGKRYVERLGYVDDDSVAKAVNDTLELCALVADKYNAWPAREIAAIIRAKKQ